MCLRQLMRTMMKDNHRSLYWKKENNVPSERGYVFIRKEQV